MELDVRQTVIVAILVLFIGKYLTRKVAFLQEYNIPEPVSGGLIASIVFAIIYGVFDIELQFSLAVRDTLLIVFFTIIGLSSRFSTLLKGGKPLIILLVIAVIYLFLQNFTGLTVAQFTQQLPEVGIIGGSVSLSGGHGTAIAWAPLFVEKYNISNAMEIGIACATFGLILGGVIGGPIAKYLISHYKLEPSKEPELTVGTLHQAKLHQNKQKQANTAAPIDYHHMLNSILIISISIGLGLGLNVIIGNLGLHLPEFVTCLFAGIIVINLGPLILPKLTWPERSRSLALISDLSLGLFLAMSLMSLQLWTLGGLGGPILIMLAAQVLIVTGFVIFVVFPLMGKDYDAAVMSAGYAGLALGATPTAIANMTAVTEKFGASAKAFVVVPLVGAFFIDIANALIIQFLLDIFAS
ncbi:sodium/glutamate symporter [Moritella sp. F3]|uniref:sodium/glutamate symporter n=1 Tax=Moritella sp. F3 TaxID=2718882 RepID=UPI0018E1C02C|nr:sodium/glutamate symporter [Moritella sp. F3]GIC79239.1 sodium/glutamate symporter [Moritella sp. F1]GIC80398.1 sodium/glutamate symporter [Moritella sp. F3]